MLHIKADITFDSVGEGGPNEMRNACLFTCIGNVTALGYLDILRQVLPNYHRVSHSRPFWYKLID